MDHVVNNTEFPYVAKVSYGQVHTVSLPEQIQLLVSDDTGRGSALELAKAVRVRTDDGQQITVQGFNDDVATSDGFVAISCDAMRVPNFRDYEYVVSPLRVT